MNLNYSGRTVEDDPLAEEVPGRRSGEIVEAEPFQARQQAGSGTDEDYEQDEHRSGTARGEFEAQERHQADARSDERVL